MADQHSDFERIWRLGRILQHASIPMWTCEDRQGNWMPYSPDREKLIQYTPEAIQNMTLIQKQLIEKWRQEHPHAILNGGKTHG